MKCRNPFIYLRCLTPRRIVNLLKGHSSLALSRFFRRPVVWGLPATLNLEITGRCNLQCRECPAGTGRLTRPLGDMPLARYKEYIDQVKGHAVYLILYFQGEPFLHPDLAEMIAYADRYRIYTMTSTNGHFFTTDEACRKVITSGLRSLIVSVDGITPESYTRYRTNGDFDRVKNGLGRLVRVRRELKSKRPRISLQFLVMRHNEHEIPRVRKFARDLGVDEVLFKSAQIYDPEDKEGILPEEEKYRRYTRDRSGRLVLKGTRKNSCRRLWVNSLITWDGRVLPCCYDKDADHSMGSLQTGTLRTIWTNTAYTRFRSKVLKNRKEIPMCTNCAEGMRVYS